MKKCIRSKKTHQFLSVNGEGWTPDLRDARAFDSVTEMLDTVRNINPGEVEMYYAFDDNTPGT